MELMATAVGRLGSRFSLVFDPDAKQILHSALGRWLDFPTDLAIGVKSEDDVGANSLVIEVRLVATQQKVKQTVRRIDGVGVPANQFPAHRLPGPRIN